MKTPPTGSALLALEDGSVFSGVPIGKRGITCGEIVFNTSMTGYQEVLTDPSYAQQIVTFTYPHIGNVGVNQEDRESDRTWAAGFVVRELPLCTSNWRSARSWEAELDAQGVIGIARVDTRHLTHLIREKGTLRACIMTSDQPDALCEEKAIQLAKAAPSMQGLDLAKQVSTTQSYVWHEKDKAISCDEEDRPHVVVYDMGVKRNILRLLARRGMQVTVVPAQTPAEAVVALLQRSGAPCTGVLFSNGPGDPEPCTYAIEAVQYFLSKNIPLMGICLGFQLLSLACGAKTIKMKFGHHGANHPVKDKETGKVLITTQNHGFAVDSQCLPDCLRVTHISLFDNSLQGVHHVTKPAFGLQGHPEACPGPQDLSKMFDYFLHLVQTYGQANLGAMQAV